MLTNCDKYVLLFLKRKLSSSQFIPKHPPVADEDVKSLQHFVKSFKQILIVTGAGVSTESGIPDYRSEKVGLYARSNHKPILYQDYLKSRLVRQRYWARNYVGWSKFSGSQPNATHHSVHSLEGIGKVSCVITQNVDGLHTKAGSINVLELHGTAFRVVCLSCCATYNRHDIQQKLEKLNPDICATTDMVRPDGDVEITQAHTLNFHPPFCDKCGGVLKPDIVFFGDNVPQNRVDAVADYVSNSEAVLVLGSSLTVLSGYRIILQAHEEKKYVAIVNIGPTRADHLTNLKISTKCGDILPIII